MQAASLGAAVAHADLPVSVSIDVPIDACDAYAARHASATAYHRRGWLTVIERAFGHRTCCLTAKTEGAVVGILPLVFFSSRVFGRFAVSLPFLNYGGILADTASAAAALLDEAVEQTRQAGGEHLELRHTQAVGRGLQARRHKVAMHLTLCRTADEEWLRLDRKVRNQVRKAEKSGVTVQIGGKELLDGFYAVFARNMRDLGTPVYSRRFFEEVMHVFPESTRVVLATVEGKPAAASILHWHRDVIEVPWASAIRDYNVLCVNVLLYWRMLEFAIGRGGRVFDFGRSTPGEGTFRFKQQWGAVPRELVWEYWIAGGGRIPDLSPGNPKFSLAIGAWRRLPLSVATALGPAIVRNIP